MSAIATPGHCMPFVGGSVLTFGYGCMLHASHGSAGLPAARHALPISWMKRIGDSEMLLAAVGLSLPRGERPVAITCMPPLTLLTASWQATRKLQKAAGAAGVPSELNCGCQKRVWFGSLPEKVGPAPGKAAVTCFANATKPARPLSVIARALPG